MIKKIRKDNFPDFNEQSLPFHSFSSQPACQKAFRKEASEVLHPVQGIPAGDSRKEEDFAVTSAKDPISLKGHLQVEKSFPGSRITQGGGSPVPYI